MNEWPWVVVPAVVIALVVRIDARLIGPYFALSSMISGTEGIQAGMWYEATPLRQALMRRFLYPAIVGFVLGWTSLSTVDIVCVGVLAAGLLLWPVVFHGLPWFVPRRTWHLPVLYASFVVAFGALAGAGLGAQQLVVDVSEGHVGAWLLDQLLGTAIFWILALVSTAVFRATFRRTRDTAIRREEIGAEATDDREAM